MQVATLREPHLPPVGVLPAGRAALPPFSMAFQPIVDVSTQTVYAYEALVRGPRGQPAASVLDVARLANNQYRLDRACRTRAIQLAADLGVPAQGAKLSINFMPGSVFDPKDCLLSTIRTATEAKFPLEALIFEILEDERIDDIPHLRNIVAEYHTHGPHVALDDFGAGYSSLTLLARISADIVKLDAGLVRNIHTCARTRTVLHHTLDLCRSLDIEVVAEAVETVEEYSTLHAAGIHLMQGFLFARPGFQCLPAIDWPR